MQELHKNEESMTSETYLKAPLSSGLYQDVKDATSELKDFFQNDGSRCHENLDLNSRSVFTDAIGLLSNQLMKTSSVVMMVRSIEELKVGPYEGMCAIKSSNALKVSKIDENLLFPDRMNMLIGQSSALHSRAINLVSEIDKNSCSNENAVHVHIKRIALNFNKNIFFSG